MKRLVTLLSILLSVCACTTAQLRKEFVTPPGNCVNHVIWGWEGNMDRKTICNDLDSIKKKGFRAVIIEAGYKLPFKYLSDDWFKAVRTGVLEAKKRGLKVWIIDEGKYPSGFAGGKFSQERPDLRMQALVVCDKINVKKGEYLSKEVPAGVLSAIAVNKSDKTNRIVDVKSGKINFNAGQDDWDIMLVKSDFKTSVTRCVNNPTGKKDDTNSLCDYLNPIAVKQFIQWTHEQYKKYLGKELGTTVLGFRGDEPDFAHLPWTPSIIDTFKEMKGYDPKPYLASFFIDTPTTEEQRVKADYWDVWSKLFATNFFGQQADWCKANGVEHITHLNNDDVMPKCIKSEGDFFRDLSKVQVPGIDVIWNQIWPGVENDFPKQASSVAHVYGKPRSFSESFAAFKPEPTIPQAKFVVDYQIARGINFFEFMFWPSGSKTKTWMSDPGMKGLNDYTNRTTYLMTQGKPGARIAMYYPVSTMWLGNNQVYQDVVTLSRQLLQRQRDFDYINDDAFKDAIKVGTGYMENKSGQRYSTLIIPSTDVISIDAWNCIKEFASRGGKVLFWGRKPSSLVDKSFTQPIPISDLPNSRYEPQTEWTANVSEALPEPELKIASSTNDSIRYIRRVMPTGDMYFIFNESRKASNITVDFDKVGSVNEWNASNGQVQTIDDATVVDNHTRLSLNMEPWGTKIISIEKNTRPYNVKDYGVKGDGSVETQALQKIISKVSEQGGGTVVIPAGTYVSGALFFSRGVDLKLEKNAKLVSTVDTIDFPIVPSRAEGIERPWRSAFLNFIHDEGVRVSGEGSIDGKGLEWKKIPFGRYGRPRLINFTDCPDGKITGIKMINQAFWCLHILYTRGFTVDGIDIRVTDYIPSSDGIDIDSSSDILITGTRISTFDDCISIKSGRDEDGRRVARPSENILIENCNFAYGHGGVTMGSEVSGSIRNVTVRSCTIDKENWNPVRFKSQPGRGGIVENITFEDINIKKARNIFDIEMEWRMVPPLSPAYHPLTQLHNIHFKNITGTADTAGIIHGYKDAPFSNDTFTFENCHIKAKKGLDIKNANINLKGLTIDLIH